jgi:alpha-L-fucosidase
MRIKILASRLSAFFFAACAATLCAWNCARGENPVHGWQPEWARLTNHVTPQWYEDAKFGIYFHWGIYSVPAFGSEWYSRNMYQTNQAAYRHHLEAFGSLDKFGYKDFIPKFTAEKFNADEWVEIFAAAGARYVGPVAEHADGFALWDSKVNPWNAARMGPKRDLLGELEKAVHKKGMKFATTFHHQWLWGWYATTVTNADVNDPQFSSFYGKALPLSAFDFGDPRPAPDKSFCDRWRAKVIEVIDHYHPDLIYFDSRTLIIDEQNWMDMLSHYYDQAAGTGREVVMTYKFNDFPTGSGVLDLECGRMASITPYKWQTDDDMDWDSWAYLSHPNYKSTTRLIHQLVDIVSKNGNLLLDIGPRPDGTIPDPVRERLLAMGAWLKVNGEAIYGTRPYKVFGEGPTQVVEGSFGETKLKGFTGQDFRFTAKGDVVYAFILAWPEDGRVRIRTLAANAPYARGKIQSVELLGHRGAVEWNQDEQGLGVKLPAKKPCDHSWVLKIIGLE